MIEMYLKATQLLRREEGQGMVEYGLIIALIAVVVMGVLLILGRSVSTMFVSVNSGLNP